LILSLDLVDRRIDNGILIGKAGVAQALRVGWVPVTNDHLLVLWASQLMHCQLFCAGTVFMANYQGLSFQLPCCAAAFPAPFRACHGEFIQTLYFSFDSQQHQYFLLR